MLFPFLFSFSFKRSLVERNDGIEVRTTKMTTKDRVDWHYSIYSLFSILFYEVPVLCIDTSRTIASPYTNALAFPLDGIPEFLPIIRRRIFKFIYFYDDRDVHIYTGIINLW
jgi:hypothetical protein